MDYSIVSLILSGVNAHSHTLCNLKLMETNVASTTNVDIVWAYIALHISFYSSSFILFHLFPLRRVLGSFFTLSGCVVFVWYEIGLFSNEIYNAELMNVLSLRRICIRSTYFKCWSCKLNFNSKTYVSEWRTIHFSCRIKSFAFFGLSLWLVVNSWSILILLCRTHPFFICETKYFFLESKLRNFFLNQINYVSWLHYYMLVFRSILIQPYRFTIFYFMLI